LTFNQGRQGFPYQSRFIMHARQIHGLLVQSSIDVDCSSQKLSTLFMDSGGVFRQPATNNPCLVSTAAFFSVGWHGLLLQLTAL